jgi:hypothetical protein
LEALQPLQEEADADELTVCPPAPFETNPQADISLLTLVLSQSGQAGVSRPNTRRSNWQPQPLHWYSKMGISQTPSGPVEQYIEHIDAPAINAKD